MNRFYPHRHHGFSLIELMVSVAIGMLALTFATRLVGSSEHNKQAALGGSDSMQSGMQALFSISGDAGQAGWGLNDPLIAGCNMAFGDTLTYTLATAAAGSPVITPLTPAFIQSNGENSDSLTLYSGSSLTGTGSLRLTASYAAGGNAITVDRVPYGFARNDVIVVAPELPGTASCALAQISSDPSTLAAPPAAQTLTFAAGAGFRFNQAAGLTVPYTAGQARVFNLGPAANLSFHTWSVSGSFLQLQATNMAAASGAPTTVVDDVVAIKAQYGFDTRPAAQFFPEAGMRVMRWDPLMFDADVNGVTGNAGDYQRIAALRIAVVARSKSPEKPVDGVCTTTTAKPIVFSTVQPEGVVSRPMPVNVAVPNDPIDWKCYRYRVFETIVPLRNSGWRPTA